MYERAINGLMRALSGGANMFQPKRAIKILVINDSVDFHLLIESYLEDYGIFCLVETDVVQGTATAIREQPDLILFDIDLPGGGGLLFLDRLRATLPISNIPVIVVTAQTDPGIQATARAQSAVAVLDKPIKKEDLIDALRQVLGAPPTNKC